LGEKKKETKGKQTNKKRNSCIWTTRSPHKNERHQLSSGSIKFDTQDDPWQKTKISVASLRRYRGRKRDRNELDWVIAMPGFSDRFPSD
jgi:hypothetical protein